MPIAATHRWSLAAMGSGVFVPSLGRSTLPLVEWLERLQIRLASFKGDVALRLFQVDGGRAAEVNGEPFAFESDLQAQVERNMEGMLGVRFLASEVATGDGHGGRIDSLGLDETGSPVIVEYKRDTSQSVFSELSVRRDSGSCPVVEAPSKFRIAKVRNLLEQMSK
ncbi:hypothetical protein [Streptomyces decoyicus]